MTDAAGRRGAEAVRAALDAGGVRSVAKLASRAMKVAELDPYLSLQSLAAYCDLSVRTLGDYIADPVCPLPHYRIGNKILVRASEFDAWIAAYRRAAAPVNVAAIVDDMLKTPGRGSRRGGRA